MKVIMAPLRPGRNDNPYLSILSDSLRKVGVELCNFHPFYNTHDADALHVHWLEFPLWGALSSKFPLWSRARFEGIISCAEKTRKRGKNVVWTVHNAVPHDFANELHRQIYQGMLERFLPLVTDVICMSDSVKLEVENQFPNLKAARKHVVRHPSYEKYFSEVAAINLPELNFPRNLQVPMFGTFGQIRSYKNVPSMISELKKSSWDFRFVIAGAGRKSEVDLIRAAIGTDERFIFIPRFINEAELVSLVMECKLIIFNFKSILNSGSVLTALSLGRKVIAPELGAIIDLQKELGQDWVKTFDRMFSHEDIKAALDNELISSRPDLNLYQPDLVASKHLSIYRGF